MNARRLASAMLSSATIGIGLFGLFAYAIHRPDLTAWTKTVPMASSTALALILIGIAALLKQ